MTVICIQMMKASLRAGGIYSSEVTHLPGMYKALGSGTGYKGTGWGANLILIRQTFIPLALAIIESEICNLISPLSLLLLYLYDLASSV